MRQRLIKAGVTLVSGLVLQLPAQAQTQTTTTNSPTQTQSVGPPGVGSVLKAMLSALPVDGMRDEVKGMVSALKKTSCGNGLTGCYTTKSGVLQLYFFTSKGAQQTFLLVINKKMAMPSVLKDKVQKVLGGSVMTDPIISISTTDYDLDVAQMPSDLQEIVRKSYFNVNTLSFASGVQMATRIELTGVLRDSLKVMGVEATQLTMRAALVLPIPTDLTAAAGTGAGLADALRHSETMKKAGLDALAPETFVEFQFAPGAVLPLALPPMNLSDATFFINNALVFGYKGNAIFKGVNNKKILLQFQTLLSPTGVMDLLDYQFRMATPPDLTLEDAALVMVAMAVPDSRLDKYGGGFIRDIESIKQSMLTVLNPLSAFKLRNPQPHAQYRFGDSSKPFPKGDKYFNVGLVGPLADGGPMISFAGNVKVLGQEMGAITMYAGRNGFHALARDTVSLKLGPLGVVRITAMEAEAIVSKDTQMVRMKGNYAGQIVEVILDGTTLTINVPPTCLSPFEIKAKATLEANINIADVFAAQAGASVDPHGVVNCVGANLQAALTTITTDYKLLSGYSPKDAAAALKKMDDDAKALAAAAAKSAAAQAAADIATKEASAALDKANAAGQKLKNTTDDAQKRANAVIAEAGKFNTTVIQQWKGLGLNDVGDELRSGLKKVGNTVKKTTCRVTGNCKKKNNQSDACLAVLDEEFYGRLYPDIVGMEISHWTTTACKDGSRAGSGEFWAPAYQAMHSDLANFNSFEALAKHWVENGKAEGRRGNDWFYIRDYRAANPDIDQAHYPSWLDYWDHWLTVGINEGRPISTEFSAKEYLANYADLRALLGDTNYPAAFDHWVIQGKNEGRKGRTDPAVVQVAADVQAVNDATVAAGNAQFTWEKTQKAADQAALDARLAAEQWQKLMDAAAAKR